MRLNMPIVKYDSIKINDIDVTLSSTCKASFSPPYNKINIQMTPTNCSLSYYEVRVTGSEDLYDIGVGKLAYYGTNIPANKKYSYTIDINSTNFSLGDITYRIGLYARSAVDDSWDLTYLFFTLDGEQFVLADGTDFSVLTTRDPPDGVS